MLDKLPLALLSLLSDQLQAMLCVEKGLQLANRQALMIYHCGSNTVLYNEVFSWCLLLIFPNKCPPLVNVILSKPFYNIADIYVIIQIIFDNSPARNDSIKVKTSI